MTKPAARAPVVVAMDGSAPANETLVWGAAEAAARHRPLRVVHAYRRPVGWDPALGVVTGADASAQAAAELAHAHAVALARRIAPETDITGRLVVAGAAPALRGEAEDAEVVVLGCRGPRQTGDLLTRPVDVSVTAHAPCPVVIVPLFATVHAGPSAARVVVGVDGSALSAAAVDIAFQAAARRDLGLTTAVHAWPPQARTT